MGVRIKKIEERVCDISNKPFKKTDEVITDYIVGENTYAEVASSTVEKIDAFIQRLGEEPKPRKKKDE